MDLYYIKTICVELIGDKWFYIILKLLMMRLLVTNGLYYIKTIDEEIIGEKWFCIILKLFVLSLLVTNGFVLY